MYRSIVLLLTLLGADHLHAEWRSATLAEHPLVGSIWEVRDGVPTSTSADRALTQLADARYVLIGEKHDNPDHHLLQARVIRQLAALGRRPAVAMEMIDDDQAAALRHQLEDHPEEVDGIARAVDWERSGWPQWSLYRPVIAAAVENRLPLVAANIPRRIARDIARRGFGAIDPNLSLRFGLDQPLPPEQLRQARQELVESHCGMLPERMIGPMLLAQRARDARMAASLLAADRGAGALLIAGNGHTRADRGVPRLLAKIAPARSALTLALLEVEADALAIGDYRELPDGFIWFTPRVDDRDPCERFAHQFKK